MPLLCTKIKERNEEEEVKVVSQSLSHSNDEKEIKRKGKKGTIVQLKVSRQKPHEYLVVLSCGYSETTYLSLMFFIIKLLACRIK